MCLMDNAVKLTLTDRTRRATEQSKGCGQERKGKDRLFGFQG